MKGLELRKKYDSFKHFLEVHEISQETVDSCFGKGYFERNPHYLNSVMITKLMHHLGHIDKRARDIYPTVYEVKFEIVENTTAVPVNRKLLKSMAALFNHSYSGPMVGKAEGEHLTWEELSEPEKALISKADYQKAVMTYSKFS